MENRFSRRRGHSNLRQFFVVKKMREGKSPEACKLACRRIIDKNKNCCQFNVKFIAVNKIGDVGSVQLRADNTTNFSYITTSGFQAARAYSFKY